MKINKSEIVNDLKLLIDISCMGSANLHRFEKFHRVLVQSAYNATDICIDYDRKRIYMDVKGEDRSGDFLVRFDQFIPTTMSVNLSYEDLSSFLKSCIVEDRKSFKEYMPFLLPRFLKGKASEQHKLIWQSAFPA